VPVSAVVDNTVEITGLSGGQPAGDFPFPLTEEVLARGQQRYNIYCSPCHGYTGEGNGMVVQRGFPAPPTFHSDQLRGMPPGFYFQVITKGFGRMFPYASQVPVDDRWAIAAYIRALQLSQSAPASSLPQEDQQKIQEKAP
jgi:mono/diheme cytochrome c family protein